VARNLEKDWTEKLTAVEQLERERATWPVGAALPLSPHERQRMLDLAEDLPALWHAPTTTPAERKHPPRLLLNDVTLTKEATTIRVALRWQTGACLTVAVPRPPRSGDARRTAATVVARIRARAPKHTDRQVAEHLNAEGWTSGRGGSVTASKVQWVRYVHGIARERRLYQLLVPFLPWFRSQASNFSTHSGLMPTPLYLVPLSV
jgi:hypothetical protein